MHDVLSLISLQRHIFKDQLTTVEGSKQTKKTAGRLFGDPAGIRTGPSVKKLPCGQF